VWLHLLDQTGVRRSESDIEWDAVDWQTGSVVVRGKTGERQIPLGKSTTLLAWLRRRHGKYPWTGTRGQRLGAATLYNLLNESPYMQDCLH